jgi:hypothetical protein
LKIKSSMRWHPRPALQRRRTIHAGWRTKKQEQLISAIENQVQHALAPESATQEHLVSAIENKVQQALAPESATQEQLISTIDNQVQHALAPEAGTSAAADDPRGSAQHADGRPPTPRRN